MKNLEEQLMRRPTALKPALLVAFALSFLFYPLVALAQTPPTGPAGGDLAGTYPNPGLAVDRVRKTGDTINGALNINVPNTGNVTTMLTLSAPGNSLNGRGLAINMQVPASSGTSILGGQINTVWGANGQTYMSFGAYNYYTGAFSEVFRADGRGVLGIGTTNPNPSSKLDVAGTINATGLAITGNINATGAITGGTIQAKYQDVAEWVESSQSLPAGTVVVLDHTRSNQVVASSQAYDTRVAGVISFQPGIALGESGAGKVLVATTGRVKIKVDASAGPIQIGDLLVTSDKEGIAKKSEPLSLGGVAIHRPGTLIGKALEPLAKGSGSILVLLSLQ